MSRAKKTYYLLKLKYFIALIFILFIALKPVIEVVSLLSDNLYELVGVLDSENSEEISEDIVDENLHFYENNCVFIQTKDIKNPNYNVCKIRYLNYHFDIFLPPPELFM